MTSNRSIDFRLYLITDRKLFASPDSMLKAIEEALKGGARAVQLREKDLDIRALLELAYRMRELTARYGAKLFINDRLDVALSVEADGVHLGVTGIPVEAARKVSGNRLVIGVSTHSVGEAKKAHEDGADFITLGPVLATPSKVQYGKPVGTEVLRQVATGLTLPVFAIGGMTISRVRDMMRQGAFGIALISAVLTAEDIRKTTEEFMRALS